MKRRSGRFKKRRNRRLNLKHVYSTIRLKKCRILCANRHKYLGAEESIPTLVALNRELYLSTSFLTLGRLIRFRRVLYQAIVGSKWKKTRKQHGLHILGTKGRRLLLANTFSLQRTARLKVITIRKNTREQGDSRLALKMLGKHILKRCRVMILLTISLEFAAI